MRRTCDGTVGIRPLSCGRADQGAFQCKASYCTLTIGPIDDPAQTRWHLQRGDRSQRSSNL